MIYFDHAATTPMHPDVAAAMLEVMQGPGGNASSMHAFGRAAKQRLNTARDTISKALGCHPSELTFTSGGTESDNLGIIGAARAMQKKGKNHVITSAIEHHAVLHTCEWLSASGFEVTVLPVDSDGLISIDELNSSINERTGLITIMHGNNEVGTIQSIETICEIARANRVLLHVDAVQSLSTTSFNLSELPVDLMSFSGHKLNGPQGVGLLYVSANTPIEPIAYGGVQERKRRPGTENIAGIIGLAKAIEISAQNREEKHAFTNQLRSAFINQLHSLLGEDNIAINGHPTQRLPHIANISFIGADTETLLMNLDLEGIAVSSGSACTSGSLERSHVLRAMGLSDERLMSAIRFSFGMGNTLEDIETAANKIATIVRRTRNNY